MFGLTQHTAAKLVPRLLLRAIAVAVIVASQYPSLGITTRACERPVFVNVTCGLVCGCEEVEHGGFTMCSPGATCPDDCTHNSQSC